MWRSFAWREALHIHSPRQVEKFVLRETLDAEGFRCALGENQNEVRQIIFFKVTITGEEEIFLPTPVAGKMLRRGGVLPSFHLPAVAMPGRDFQNRGDTSPARFTQREQAIA